MLLACHCFFSSMAYYSVLMFRWRINRVEFEVRALRFIDNIMSSASGDDDSISVLDMVFNAINNHLSLSSLKAKELIYIDVRFLTYFFSRLNVHEHELAVLPCIQHTAKIGVLPRLFLKGYYVSLHIYHLD